MILFPFLSISISMRFTQGCASTQESGEGAGKLELARLFFWAGIFKGESLSFVQSHYSPWLSLMFYYYDSSRMLILLLYCLSLLSQKFLVHVYFLDAVVLIISR